MSDNFELLKIFLENIKKDFNDLNFSLVFSVVDNRMNVTITDRQEKKPYGGISSRNIDDVGYFLGKNLEKLKIAWFYLTLFYTRYNIISVISTSLKYNQESFISFKNIVKNWYNNTMQLKIHYQKRMRDYI